MSRNVKALGDMTKHLTNEEKAQRKEMEETLNQYSKLDIMPPDWLTDYALEEWNRVTPILLKETPVSELDKGLLVAYCETYSLIKTCTLAIKKEGTVVGGKENRNLRLREKAVKDLRSLSNDLGLSISSRARLALNKAQEIEKDEIGDLLE